MRARLTKKWKQELIKKYGHVPTKKEIFQKLKESQERLIYPLAGAWQTAPDDPEERKKLLKSIKEAIKLREKVYKMIGEKPPEIDFNNLESWLSKIKSEIDTADPE